MNSVAVVGAVGGAGTTRTCLALAGILARDGRSVVILDAAYATQGLSDHVPGRIAPDMTALVVDDLSLASGSTIRLWSLLLDRSDVPVAVKSCLVSLGIV